MNQTIVVADDDAGVLLILGKMLRAEGYEVIGTPNGSEVLEIAERTPPMLFMLDVVMPSLDGLEVCRRLKLDPRFKRIPVIFITARKESNDIVLGFQAGAADYIGKPINREETLARVNSQISLYQYMLELERLNQLALDANPSTGLPGNNSIAAAVTKAIKDGGLTSVIYCDLDNFKAFNDKYGFARGDQVIKFTGRIIQESMAAVCRPEGFVGHIGGDDFVLLSPADKAEAMAHRIIRVFDQGIKDFYNQQDAAAGKIMSKDRQGRAQEFPLMAISIGVVELGNRSFSHYQEVANLCAEVKEVAKSHPGSCVFFDRRRS